MRLNEVRLWSHKGVAKAIVLVEASLPAVWLDLGNGCARSFRQHPIQLSPILCVRPLQTSSC